MKLPTWRQLTYISPSTFLKWSSCEFKIYLQRLAGLPYIEEKQGWAAALGSAIDAFLKDYIAKKKNINNIATDLNNLITKNVSEEHRESVLPLAKRIAKIYIDLGLIEEFVSHTGDIHLDVELFATYNNIPILGQLDLIKDRIVPVDWKTGGFTEGTHGRYPTKGYHKRIDYNLENDKVILDHPKKDADIKAIQMRDLPLEDRNINWAIQMTFYNWLLRNYLAEDRKFIIHEIVHHRGIISFALHEGYIGNDFVIMLSDKLRDMWDAIYSDMYSAEIEEPTPTKQICEAYGVVCPVAHRCKYYEATLGSEEARMGYVMG